MDVSIKQVKKRQQETKMYHHFLLVIIYYFVVCLEENLTYLSLFITIVKNSTGQLGSSAFFLFSNLFTLSPIRKNYFKHVKFPFIYIYIYLSLFEHPLQSRPYKIMSTYELPQDKAKLEFLSVSPQTFNQLLEGSLNRVGKY